MFGLGMPELIVILIIILIIFGAGKLHEIGSGMMPETFSWVPSSI